MTGSLAAFFTVFFAAFFAGFLAAGLAAALGAAISGLITGLGGIAAGVLMMPVSVNASAIWRRSGAGSAIGVCIFCSARKACT